MFKVPEIYRIRRGNLGSTAAAGDNGAFHILYKNEFGYLGAIASSGDGWEHVSVSTPVRCPTWQEMCDVKALFWGPEDCVMQLHPPQSQWVNNHPFCLHLWRPKNTAIPQPPKYMV